MKPLALYIHVPFCIKKCAYCDFVSYPGREDVWQAYFDVLEQEIVSAANEARDRTVTSVYFGGGTPSLAPRGRIARVLRRIYASYAVSDDAEITLEANPGTLSREKLDEYREAGINRLSIGAQSFSGEELRTLGRIHDPEDVARSVEWARTAGFQNLSLDLMYELPGQTEESWAETLENAMSLAPQHISAYTLIVEDGTPLSEKIRRGELSQPGEEACARMRETANEFLRRGGYQRYEISNYAQPGRRSRHNFAYWMRQEYYGFGCAAHSFFDGVRFHNPEGLEEYLSGARRLDSTVIDRAGAMEEWVMLMTRTSDGLDLPAFSAAFGRAAEEGIRACAGKLREMGYLAPGEARIALNDRGMDVHSAIVLELLRAAERAEKP